MTEQPKQMYKSFNEKIREYNAQFMIVQKDHVFKETQNKKKQSEKDRYFLPGYWRGFEWQQVHSGWKNLQESVSLGVISAIISRQLTNFFGGCDRGIKTRLH